MLSNSALNKNYRTGFADTFVLHSSYEQANGLLIYLAIFYNCILLYAVLDKLAVRKYTLEISLASSCELHIPTKIARSDGTKKV